MGKDRSIQGMNEHLAGQIGREARENPSSPYANKFVGIANGKVVAVADTLREVDLRLDEVEPNPANCRIVDTIGDYETVQEIWSSC
jgi:Family of unknown function (DUF5678)